MELIVDLHLHSHYSRSTSKNMDLKGLYQWGKLKGIDVLGTGDSTHPAWFQQLTDELEPADGHLYQLKQALAKQYDAELPEWCRSRSIRFIPTVEISTIYSKAGRVRKLHQVVVSPDLDSAASLNHKLSKIGNLAADGRPILGLDSKHLLEIVMSVNDAALFIPAHVWTPWFGLFGSKSGFDTVTEAYEELSDKIVVVETGLSADPLITLQLSELHDRAIVSHSDAHSPQKLGREATVFNCAREYDQIIGAIKTNDARLQGTIEFYPEEGKYYFDGHRKCGIIFSPQETAMHQGKCPVCGRGLTVGVLNRVTQLSGQTELKPQNTSKHTEYIIPLTQLLAHQLQVKSSSSKRVQLLYHQMLTHCGDEFSILRSLPVEELYQRGFGETAELIASMRRHEITIDPGYDGVYGSIAVKTNLSH